jgi:hypothetical protein
MGGGRAEWCFAKRPYTTSALHLNRTFRHNLNQKVKAPVL